MLDFVQRAGLLRLYGFVIDQRKCIGCYACTMACKEGERSRSVRTARR